VASRDTNFYYSFLVLPAEKRRAIVAVWDFCRAVDDAVDHEADEVRARMAVDGWRREIEACYGGSPTTPEGGRLLPFIQLFKLPRQPFDDLVDGVAMDIGGRRYATFDELYEYCRRVASAVGLICLEIFGYRNPRARQYATDLGVALQLTNILRDVPADLSRDRVYLPLEDLARYQCTEADLQAEVAHAGSGIRSRAVHSLLKFEAHRARAYYRRARQELPAEDARRLVAAEIMGAIYLAILDRIERSGYDVFSTVARVPRPRRAVIAATTWARTMIGIGGRDR
jgi:phytoene synthase